MWTRSLESSTNSIYRLCKAFFDRYMNCCRVLKVTCNGLSFTCTGCNSLQAVGEELKIGCALLCFFQMDSSTKCSFSKQREGSLFQLVYL